MSLKYDCILSSILLKYSHFSRSKSKNMLSIAFSTYSRNIDCVSWFCIRYLSEYGCDIIKCEVKAIQSCLTLCDPMDCTVHGILQARATPFFTGSSQPRDWTQVSHIAGGFFSYILCHRYDLIHIIEIFSIF